MGLFDRSNLVYFGSVFGVIAVASLAMFNLRGMAAKAHRHWDADIDRIIARQQAKKQDTRLAMAQTGEPGIVRDVGPQIAALTRAQIVPQVVEEPAPSSEEAAVASKAAAGQKAETAAGRKSVRRVERRRHHFIPPAFASLPRFAGTAAAATTALFRLR